MMRSKNLAKSNEGVSPVVGVILMVAITVVMAAIVSSWSSTVKTPTQPTTVGLDISRSNDTLSIVIASIDPASAAPIPEINLTYYNATNETTSIQGVVTNTAVITNAEVGNTRDIDTNSTTQRRLVIVAKFKDFSKKVLYNQET